MKVMRRLAVPGLVALALLTGCGGAAGGNDGTMSAICNPTGADVEPGVPIVAVLGQIGETDPVVVAARRNTLATVVDGAMKMQAHFLLNGVGAGPATPHLLVSTRLAEEGPNRLFRKRNLACKAEAITTAAKQLLSAGQPSELDVFAALRTLKADVEGLGERRIDVVLLSSLLNHRLVDLRDRAVLSDPARAINQLARAQLNFRCEGWRVYAVSGGDEISNDVDTLMRGFWRAYFEHCGGELVAYNTQLAQFPLEGGAVAVADTSTMPIRVVRTRKAVAATLDSEVLFEVGSARLRAKARSGLRRLVPLLRRTPGTVNVDGHTDSTGTDEVNRPLSLARARSVANWLEANDPRRRTVRTHGYGASRPAAPNRTADGRARNRRVVVTIER